MNTELKTASVLAFERKLDPSDGLFYAGKWDDRSNSTWPALIVREKSIRGTISNRLKTADRDSAKLDANIQNPNLQKVDVATLPHDADTLRIAFTLRVLGGTGRPSACNNQDYQQRLEDAIDSYKENVGFDELSRRYATNIANGRFLWRNRISAEEAEITVRHVSAGKEVHKWMFKALQYRLRTFDSEVHDNGLNELTNTIRSGLLGENYVFLEITAHARVGFGQEVYPSQELILNRGRDQGQKSKTLYQINGVAAMHSQKIGNALRTIDTWYSSEDCDPIAVEPYGSVTPRGTAYRPPRAKNDFYTLLDAWMLKGTALAIEDQHFVIANFIRGGVFGESEKGS